MYTNWFKCKVCGNNHCHRGWVLRETETSKQEAKERHKNHMKTLRFLMRQENWSFVASLMYIIETVSVKFLMYDNDVVKECACGAKYELKWVQVK